MDTYVMVRPEHLNHHGALFGGQLLLWIDEYSWIAASQEFPKATFVTRAMEASEFKTRVVVGSILRISISLIRRGTTSVTYMVDVYARAPGERLEEKTFSTQVVLVSVNEQWLKTPLPL